MVFDNRDKSEDKPNEQQEFGRALTHTQCFQYALDRLAVMTALPGVRNMEDLHAALKYVTATSREKDYSAIGEFTPQNAYGICICCIIANPV